MPVTAREAAYKALGAFRRDGAWPDRALETDAKALSPRDVRLAARILGGTIQNLVLCDFYISWFSNSGIKKIEPQVLDIMRISVYQILFMSKIPPSAAVSEGVALARRKANPRAAGFVNAVLRKLADAAANGKLPEIKGRDESERLSILYSHPEWLVRALRAELPESDLEALLRENNSGDVPVTAQVNTLKTDIASVIESLHADSVDASAHPWLPDCIEMHAPGNVTALKAFEAGHIYIQDASARLAVLASGIAPGDTVLDACAAPGGKSLAAAILMGNRGEIVSCDVFDKKLRLIESSAKRLGVNIIKTYALDATVYKNEFGRRFDVVIADAPCSGLGVIRKKPEIRFKTEQSIASLPETQLSILTNLARYVKPGGRLIYSTCTVLRRENEEVARAFLSAHPDFSPEGFSLPGKIGDVPSGMITLWPHIHASDGFFICRMQFES